jgi:hypothetical protein
MLDDCSIVLNNTKCFLATGGFVLSVDPKLFFFVGMEHYKCGEAKMARNINKQTMLTKRKGRGPPSVVARA